MTTNAPVTGLAARILNAFRTARHATPGELAILLGHGMEAGMLVAAACRPRSNTASNLWLLPVVIVPPLMGISAISPPP